jgi:hypothetical protein
VQGTGAAEGRFAGLMEEFDSFELREEEDEMEDEVDEAALEAEENEKNVSKSQQPLLWSACNDRGSNVVKGMTALLAEKDKGEEEGENGEDAGAELPCDANNCLCHLCKGAVDALLEGRYGAKAFARDSEVVLGVSSVLQRKGEGLDLLQEVASVETAHLTPIRKGETRWEGLYQCWGRAIKMKIAWVGFFEDKDVGHACLDKAGVKRETDFPQESFWVRGQFYLALLTEVHVLSKWAQLERQPNMMFLADSVTKLVRGFAAQDGEDNWKAELRDSFRTALQELVLERVVGGETPFAVRAALFNPLVDVSELVDDNTVRRCEGIVLEEMCFFFPAAEKAEYDDQTLEQVLKLSWEGFKLTKGQFRKKLLEVRGGTVSDYLFSAKVDLLKEFWVNSKSRFPEYISQTAKSYWSAPVASSKSESTFSYSGEVVTKKRNKLGVHLTEAMTVGYDWTRQPHFGFDNFVAQVFGLDAEYQKVKKNAEASRLVEKRALKARLRELERQE